jgi:2-amino-4-hydroxy-6-hydroxymethyldihydropteridine diphosphokinase
MNNTAIAIGSNQGNSARICRDASALLQKLPSIHILRASSLYRTKPVGVTEQDWFINGALLCETSLEPQALLELLHELENEFGRVRAQRWGPRTLDLDILFYGDLQLDLPGLKLPHPRMHERLFVLAPLAEIEPDWVHPGLGLSVREMLDRVLLIEPNQEVYKLEE